MTQLPDSIPVLIAGAGPVGMTTAILLARQGIRSLIVEKRDRINTLPRSRGITQRTVEIFATFGLGPTIYAMSLPPDWTKHFVYTETLAGELVGVMPTVMVPGRFAAFSPCEYRIAAQDRIDPMLYDCLAGYSQSAVHFNTEVIGYAEDGDSIIVTLRTPDGAEATMRCGFLVAADGARSSLREMSGVG